MSACKDCKSEMEVHKGRCKECRMKWYRRQRIGSRILQVASFVRNYCPDCEGTCQGHEAPDQEEGLV